jgi:glutathione synthase/RimK-type ligase-like ATP-grasp enzyme
MTSAIWYHRYKKKELYMGNLKLPVPYKGHSGPHHSFFVDPVRSHVMTVGILTCKKNNNERGLGGNLRLFRELTGHLNSNGIVSFVLAVEDVLQGDFSGFIYSESSGNWEKVSVPLPDVVYNRIPSRGFESSKAFLQFKQILDQHSIPIFNPRFVHKLEIYELLRENNFLHNLLPETILLSSSRELFNFLIKHQTLYLKPVTGNKGSGISILSLQPDGKVVASTTKTELSYNSFNEFWIKNAKKYINHKYIAQQAVKPKKLDGHRYDYRILVHYDEQDYKITGKAIRMSQAQEVTTHVPRGGRIYPYELLKNENTDLLIEKVAGICGKILSEKLGFFGEFSMDLGEDEAGNLYLFEINSKPMHFDETEIENNRLEKLKKIFTQLIHS